MMRRASLVTRLLVALVVAACGGASPRGAVDPVAALRAQAAEEPANAPLQARLAVAELFHPGGDATRARVAIDRARALAPDDLRLAYASAVEHDLHARPDEALDDALMVLRLAVLSDDPAAPALAELAAALVEGLGDRVPDYAATVQAHLEAVLEQPGRIGAPAHYAVSDNLITLAFRRGDLAEVRRRVSAQGCLTTWRVAGPVGPYELLGFDDDPAAFVAEPLGNEVDLGAGRGVRPVRPIEARGCTAHLGAGGLAEGGTTYAEAEVALERAGDYVVRIETPNAVELFIDGRSVVRRDSRVAAQPRTSYHELRLGAGTHRVTARIATRHPNPVLGVAIMDSNGARAGSAMHAARCALPTAGADSPAASYVRAALALHRGDFGAAREELRSLEPGGALAPSAAVLTLGGAIALSDSLATQEVRRDQARVWLRRAADADPEAWYAAYQLARFEGMDGDDLEALGSLELAATRFANIPSIASTLATFEAQRGWDDQAEARLVALTQRFPGLCAPIEQLLSIARSRATGAEALALADRVVACDARSDARYSVLVAARRWEAAAAELSRLEALEPPTRSYPRRLARLQLARATGDDTAIAQALEALAEVQPRSSYVALEQADHGYSQGGPSAARRVLEAAIAREPAAMGELRRVHRALGGDDELAAYRLDGREVLRTFEASGRTYDSAQVLVLDYTVVRVFEDGSTLELTHNIRRAQSEESLDELGEYAVPDGAELLALHTIKPDGRRLEPDAIAGKDTISLPSLAVGDYVEVEYALVGEPPPAFPTGFLAGGFTFQSFEVPFDRSEYIVVMPREFEPVIETRGEVPRLETRDDGDVRVYRWLAMESRPFVAEPMAVNAREFLPSVTLGVRATWPQFVARLRDVLADRDVIDPAARRLVAQIVGEAREPLTKAQRIYRWVVDHIEDSNDPMGLAPAMLSARRGHRTRVLHYLLRMAGLDARLALARGNRGDSLPSELPNPDTYRFLLVRLDLGEQSVWLSGADRGSPFGFIAPVMRDQPAVLLDTASTWTRVTQRPELVDRRIVEATVDASLDGRARVSVVETNVGSSAVVWRSHLEQIPAAEVERVFGEAYVARSVPGAVLTRLVVTGRDDPDRPLVLTYDFEVASLGRARGEGRSFEALFRARLAQGFARMPERQTTMLIGEPTNTRIVLRVRAADADIATPTDASVRTAYGTFSLRTRRDGPEVVIEREFDVPAQRVEPAAYADFAAFCRTVDAADAAEIELTRR